MEILDILKGGGSVTPYEIAFHLGLNRKRTKQYIEFLLNKGFSNAFIKMIKRHYIVSPLREGLLLKI